MSKKIISAFLLALLVLALAVSGCGQQTSQAPKTIKIGTEATFPPFEFQDDKTKEYVGFDIDLVKAIAKQMGCEAEIVSMGFDGLVPALEAQQIDVIAAGMSITPERAEKVAFSDPYYKSGLSIVVKNSDTTIKSFKDLEGKRLAVQIGTTGAEEAKKIASATVREFNSSSDAYMELVSGGADAVVNDHPVNQYYLVQGGSKESKLVGDILNSEDYGLAINKKNTELSQKINAALAEIKKNGEYDKIYQKWFGAKVQ
ncbi:MAG: ABC-type transporter, periplasmic subunit family 3 [Firmicutes bacterium]|nr:ABC-type transporter, periplasmic subunit family 3 [Bacillota bacterium]